MGSRRYENVPFLFNVEPNLIRWGWRKNTKIVIFRVWCVPKKTTRFPPSINNSVVGRRVVRKKFKVEKKDRSSEQTLKNSASGQKKEKEEKIQKYPKASQNNCQFYLWAIHTSKGLFFWCSEWQRFWTVENPIIVSYWWANCDLIDGSTHGSKLRNVPLMFDTAGPQDKQRTVGPRLAHSATQTVPTITANTFYKAEKYILQF